MRTQSYKEECVRVSQRMRSWIARNPDLYREIILQLQSAKYTTSRPLTVASVIDDKMVATYPVTRGHYNIANSYLTRYIIHNTPKELEDATFYAKKSEYLDSLDYSPVANTDVSEQLKIEPLDSSDKQTEERKPGWLKRLFQWIW